jgi:hypothetical protein
MATNEAALSFLINQVQEEKSRELAALRAQQAELEARSRAYALNSEINGALAGYEFTDQSAREQATLLVRSELSTHVNLDGSPVVHGPNWETGAELIHRRMGSPEFQRFLAPGSTAKTPAQTPPSPLTGQGKEAQQPPTVAQGAEQAEGESLGQFWIRSKRPMMPIPMARATAGTQRASLDPRQSFGLKPVR